MIRRKSQKFRSHAIFLANKIEQAVKIARQETRLLFEVRDIDFQVATLYRTLGLRIPTLDDAAIWAKIDDLLDRRLRLTNDQKAASQKTRA